MSGTALEEAEEGPYPGTPLVEDLEPEQPAESEAEYWVRMAHRDPVPERPTVATVSCTNPSCGHRGQWHHVADTIDGPLHCGGCFTVLHCDHSATVATTRFTGTLAAPLVVSSTTCTKCHHVIRKTQAAATLDQIPLEVVHSAVQG